MEEPYTETDTQRIATEILAGLVSSDTHATVLALEGDLGAGKTTLTKAIAKLLGVGDTLISPTFVVAKFYHPAHDFDVLVHIDAYRIEDTMELGPLGWQTLLQQPRTLIVVEWPERIVEALPEEKVYYRITHAGDARSIKQIS